jgi:hypothetical protein
MGNRKTLQCRQGGSVVLYKKLPASATKEMVQLILRTIEHVQIALKIHLV